MVPEDLLFWIAPLSGTPHDDQNVLCLRHADAMSVPRGWTLDDRREAVPRLFMPRPVRPRTQRPPVTPRSRRARHDDVEQLVIDGTGETARPSVPNEPIVEGAAPVHADAAPWRPEFDHENDLDGLLEVASPLLARAFRGTDRPRD